MTNRALPDRELAVRFLQGDVQAGAEIERRTGGFPAATAIKLVAWDPPFEAADFPLKLDSDGDTVTVDAGRVEDPFERVAGHPVERA